MVPIMESGSSSVIITGASGLIGRHLRRALRDRQVMLLGRHRLDLASNEAWERLDLAESVHFPSLPPGSVLCHMAYAMAQTEKNIAFTHRAIDAVNRCSAIDHVIMMSSASVYGDGAKGVINEETPLRPDSNYGRIKAACDQAWLDQLRPDCRLTVLRPTAVVASDGPGMDALVHDALHRPGRSVGKRILQHRSTVHFVAIETVVAAIQFALNRNDGGREVFVVSDDDASEQPSYAEFQDHVRAVLSCKPLHAPPLPRIFERAVGATLGKPLGVRRIFSGARLADAGFVSTGPSDAAFAEVIRARAAQVLAGVPSAQAR